MQNSEKAWTNDKTLKNDDVKWNNTEAFLSNLILIQLEVNQNKFYNSSSPVPHNKYKIRQ
jgi:hypothetical protein